MNLPRLLRLAVVTAAAFALIAPLSATTVGVLLKGRTQFWMTMEQGAANAGRKLGATVVTKMPPNESDIGVQIQLLNGFVAQGVDAIVLAPDSKDALAAPVAAAAAKGIKIVVVDSPLDAGYVFVGTNHTDAGTAAGRLLARLVGEKDEVGFLRHSQTSVATNLREASALIALRAVHPNLTVHRDIFSGAENGVERQKAALLLAQHPNTRAVLASGTPGTLAMLRVLEEKQPPADIKLVGFGFDLTPEVATALGRGKLHGWVAQLPREIGARAVEAAVKLAQGEAVPAVIACDFMVITPDNLNDPKVQALLAP